jgi:hypothetical protein
MQTNKLSYIASGISEQTDECAIRIWVSERKGIFSHGMDVNPFFKSLKVNNFHFNSWKHSNIQLKM